MYGKEISGICPVCNKAYIGRPALSRVDNKTMICPDCGTRESLQSIGVKAEEQEKILRIIHNSYGERGTENDG